MILSYLKKNKMSSYLSTIHLRSHAHKKGFAFGVSAGITLSIFTIWSLVTFSSLKNNDSAVVAKNVDQQNTTEEIPPLNTLKSGVASSFQALKDQFGNLKGSVKAVDLNNEYQTMRNDAVNQNGN